MGTTNSLDVCMAQRANMEAIFHSVADGLVTIDLDGRVTNVNTAAEALLEVAGEEAAGRSMSEFVVCRAWSVRDMCRQVVETGAAVRGRIPEKEAARALAAALAEAPAVVTPA